MEIQLSSLSPRSRVYEIGDYRTKQRPSNIPSAHVIPNRSQSQTTLEDQFVDLKTIQIEPQVTKQKRESVVSLSGVLLELEEPKLGTVPEERSESEFIEDAKLTLNELEAGLGKMEKELEK